MATTTVTRNYQITLPRDIREIENIEIGDRVTLSMNKGVIEIRKFSKEKFLSCFGLWGKKKVSSIDEVRRIRRGADSRLKRLGL
jgi:AbrB family looped-hinge helix DNA binding protein